MDHILPADTAVEQMIASCADWFEKDKETRERKSTTAAVLVVAKLGKWCSLVSWWPRSLALSNSPGEIWIPGNEWFLLVINLKQSKGQPCPEGGMLCYRDSRSGPCALFQVRLMITDAARHKLLLLTGQCFENTGELILQSGSFSFQNFIEIFTDQEVGCSLGVSKLYNCLVTVTASGCSLKALQGARRSREGNITPPLK